MTQTSHLGLPLIAAAQAQKHVTHNEAIAALDAMVQMAVIEQGRNTPPASPVQGNRYLVGSAPTGLFIGHAGKLAHFDVGLWRFHQPRVGWRIYVQSDDSLHVYDGTIWRDIGFYVGDLGVLDQLGVGTAADSTNRLAIKTNAALMTARTIAESGTGDLRVVMNKEAAGATASQVFQSNFSGRAEIGLAGDDDLRIKVSSDGTIWRDAVQVARATGIVSFPQGVAGLSGGPAVGQCRLTLNGGNLLLSRFNGALLTINGTNQTVPSTGLTLAPTGLTASTLYYIYAYMVGAVMTLEASITVRATHATSGLEIKTGDATRTLVGMAYVLAGPVFADNATNRLVISWFNQRALPMSVLLATTVIVTNTAFIEVSTALRLQFLSWGSQPTPVAVNGSWTISGAATAFARVNYNGSSNGVARAVTSVTNTTTLVLSEIASTVAVGYNYVTLQGYRDGGTNVHFFGTSAGSDYGVSLAATTMG